MEQVPKGNWYCSECCAEVPDLYSEMEVQSILVYLTTTKKPKSKRGRDHEFVQLVKSTLTKLGKPSTGLDIAQKIIEDGFGQLSELKLIKFRALAVVSCKSYADHFVKAQKIEVNGREVSAWMVTVWE